MKPINFSSGAEAMSRSNMLRIVQLICVMMLLGASARSAFGFSMVGPPEAYQTGTGTSGTGLGYDRTEEFDYPFTFYTSHFVDWQAAPKNIGEGYRWNIPILYYTFDATFLDYFGGNGVHAVDSAIKIFNDLPPASQMDINDFPPDEARFNYTAAALHLFDLKSAAVEMLIGRLGLTDPERWTWTLRDRALQPGASCPNYDYIVIQRNFDPDTLSPSRYVNGNLFTYVINQTCPPGFPDRAEAVEVLVDPIDNYLSALATPKVTVNFQSAYGLFHVGLTRDDAAGLQHLYRTNKMNLEVSAPDVQLFNTNNTLQLLFTSNLTLFAAQALTNSAAALQALYPNLVVASSTITGFSNIYATNIVGFLTNQPWAPAGTFQIGFRTNFFLAGFQTNFAHIFANVLTFQLVGGRWTAIPLTTISQINGVQIIANQTANVVITNPPWAPPGSNAVIATNITTRLRVLTGPVGEIAILPTNFCDVSIVSALLTNVVPETNVIATFTNVVAGTNPIPGQVLQSTLSVVDFFTNHIFAIFPISCTFSNVAVRQGIDKVSFARHDFDPLLSRFFTPITNDFDVVAQATNNIRYVEHFRRIITRPDILFAAGDAGLTALPFVETVDHTTGQSTPNFNTNTVPPNPIPTAGPGTIEGPANGGPMVLTFNKVGPTYFNSATSFFGEADSIFYYQWASFDGSTNAPILYPNSASLAALEQQAFIQISPSSLPAGVFGNDYNANISVSGGTPPYFWSPVSGQFPPGLSLDTVGTNDGADTTISGTPGMPGTYVFTIRVTDNGGLSADMTYGITIAQP
jgi:hypothetical protein